MKKKNRGLIVSLVVLLIGICVIGGVIIYGKTKEQNKVADVNAKDNLTITQLDINSPVVFQLYNYIFKDKYAVLSSIGKELYYTNNKITYNDLNDYYKFLVATSICNDSEKTTLSGSSVFNNSTFEETKNVTETEYLKNYDIKTYKLINWEAKYTKETIENKLHQIYGPSTSIQFVDFTKESNVYTGYCLYKNGAYECGRWNGGTETGYSNMTKLVSAETDGDNIYIYDKYIMTEEIASAGSIKVSDFTFNMYSTSDKSNLIVRGVSYDEYYKKYSNNFNNIESEFGTAVKTHKHTFKKDQSGNYYWISSEVVG